MRLAEIERHVSSIEELQRIVGAMRAIASMRVQEALRALTSVREYGSAMAAAVREALAIAADERIAPGEAQRGGRRAIVVFTSEHGFVGGFNERLLEAAGVNPDVGDTLLIVGSRGGALASDRGLTVASTHAMATRLASVPEVVERVREGLYSRIASAEIKRAEVVFGSHQRSGATVIGRRQLFPLDLSARRERFEPVPLHDLPAAELLERLTAEYILSQLTEAATESLAAENAARFAAMEAAHDNVGKKVQALRLDASRARQEEVTTELLDLVIGQQAVDKSLS
ncbi:MAG TPA: F0F1 ATP synthase subunit gamma [Steroidobacteraceae bacterium]|jgi:F-type H+-transporting ATPase subunit gamma